MRLSTSAGQIVGDRPAQHDAYGTVGNRGFVADGVGLEHNARDAADIAIRTLLGTRMDHLPGPLLDAGASVRRELQARGCDGGTTLAGFVLADEQLWIVNIGDSRVLVLRGPSVVHHTARHRKSDEMWAINPSRSPSEEDASILTRYLHRDCLDDADVSVVRAAPGDLVLAMTDGVENVMYLEHVGEIAAAVTEPDDVVRAILARAAEFQTPDNATIVAGLVTSGGEDGDSEGGRQR